MLESVELPVNGNLNGALVRAAANGHVDVVDYLIRHAMFDPSGDANRAIQEAAVSGHIAVVERLLQDERVDPSANENYAVKGAATNGHLAVVERPLQDNRVDPSANDNWAVRFAAYYGHFAVVERLLQDVRVDPSANDNRAVRLAASRGRLAVVDRLLEDDRVDFAVAIRSSQPEHRKRFECRERTASGTWCARSSTFTINTARSSEIDQERLNQFGNDVWSALMLAAIVDECQCNAYCRAMPSTRVRGACGRRCRCACRHRRKLCITSCSAARRQLGRRRQCDACGAGVVVVGAVWRLVRPVWRRQVTVSAYSAPRLAEARQRPARAALGACCHRCVGGAHVLDDRFGRRRRLGRAVVRRSAPDARAGVARQHVALHSDVRKRHCRTSSMRASSTRARWSIRSLICSPRTAPVANSRRSATRVSPARCTR
jgi:surface antigen